MIVPNNTGQWTWRDGELSYKEFTLLTKHKQQDYLNFLNSLPKDERSSNDLSILRWFWTHKQINNFITLKDEKTSQMDDSPKKMGTGETLS